MEPSKIKNSHVHWTIKAQAIERYNLLYLHILPRDIRIKNLGLTTRYFCESLELANQLRQFPKMGRIKTRRDALSCMSQFLLRPELDKEAKNAIIGMYINK